MSLRKRLASQSAVIFGARILGAAIIFIVQAAIARFWGANILGKYMLIIAVVNLIMVFLPLGFQTIGTYFVAEYRAKNDRKMLKSFLLRAYSHVLIMGGLVGILIVPFSKIFGDLGQVILPYWPQITLLAISIAVVYVNSAILIGLKRPFVGFFSDALFRPLLVIISFGIAVAYFENAEALFAMLWMMAIGITLIALMQLSIVIVTAKRVGDKISHRASEAKRWWRFAVPWVIIAVANDFFFDIDIIILSSFLEPHELAIFGVISRVFVLISFGVVAVYAVSVPDMFESEANNDRSAFLQKVGDANLVAAALSLAMVIGVTIFGGYVLSIFGPDFVAGHMPLVILSVALLVRSIFGPAALVLSIYDKPYASLPSVIIGLFSLVSLNYYLVPSYSLMGAAIAALISIAIWSIAQWFTALKLAKVDISIFAAIKHHLPLILKAQ